MAECSFCGNKILPGTGVLFVKKEGTAFFFCSRKCEKNMLVLKRKPSSMKWSLLYEKARKPAAAVAEKPVEEKPVVEKAKQAKGKKKRIRRKKHKE